MGRAQPVSPTIYWHVRYLVGGLTVNQMYVGSSPTVPANASLVQLAVHTADYRADLGSNPRGGTKQCLGGRLGRHLLYTQDSGEFDSHPKYQTIVP